ncbi:MAG: glycosyltransferase, partial [Candidatus Kerfeldbacteria bacterium]|nr:glycosyltransferase [Candidatus Kerfeldbacteria bacterium]
MPASPRPPLRVVLVGGSTGGATVPLLPIAGALRKGNPNADLLLIGTQQGPEQQFARQAGLAYRGIRAGKLRRYFSILNLLDAVQLVLGAIDAWRLLRQFRPDAIISVGSYVSVPVVYVGRLLGIPSLIHQQDVQPGLANRLCAPVATAVTVAFPETASRFPAGKTTVAGNPIRTELLAGNGRRAFGRFGLHKTLPVVLAFGGGTGALRLNQLVAEAGLNLVKRFQVLHVTGGRQDQFRVTHPNYHSFNFLVDGMADAYAVADIVVCRAGLSSLSEIAALGKPAIVIPIPDSHQQANAAYFARQDAAVVLDERTLDRARLEQAIRELYDDADARSRLSRNVRALARPDAAEVIARQVEQLGPIHHNRKLLRVLASAVAEVRLGEPIAKHSHFKLGGPADVFVVCRAVNELTAAIRAVRRLRIPWVVLGGGANSVFPDAGYRGAVIQVRNAEFSRTGNVVKVGAGMNTGQFASRCLEAGLVGMEFIVGIYGSVGGAVRGNAGSFGREMRDIVRSCTVVTDRGRLESWTAEQLRFGYRDSRLKHTGGVVAEVECQLAAGDVAASRRRIAEYTAYKQAHQPLAVPSAGCLFKNVSLTPDDQRLRQRFAAVIKDNRLPAWALISAAG